MGDVEGKWEFWDEIDGSCDGIWELWVENMGVGDSCERDM